MKKEEIIRKLIAVLDEFKVDDFGAAEVEIIPTTVPIEDIPGFDSLLVVTATTHICEAFDIPDDKNFDNLFGNRKQDGEVVYFSVRQIAEKIMKIKKG